MIGNTAGIRMRAANPRTSAAALSLILLFLLAPVTGAFADTETSFDAWTRGLEKLERALESGSQRPQDLESPRQQVRSTSEALRASRSEALQELEASRKLLNALGPPPDAGEPAETPEVAQERRHLQSVVTGWEGQIKQADLLLERADALLNRINAKANRARAVGLLTRGPSPLAADRLVAAADGLRELVDETIPEMLARLAAVRASFGVLDYWLVGLTLAVVLLLASLPLILRRWNWLHRRAGVAGRPRATALNALGAAAFGIVGPASAVSVAGLALYRVPALQQASPLLLQSVALGLATTIAVAVIRAPLIAQSGAPAFPIRIALARRLARRLVLFVCLVACGMFIGLVAAALHLPTALVELADATLDALAAVVLFLVIRGRIWRDLAAARRGDVSRSAPVRVALRALPAIRILLALPLASPALTLAGYDRLADLLLKGVTGTGLIVWTYWLLRSAQREGLAILLRRGRRRARRGRLIQILVFAFADMLLALAALSGIAIAWGVDLTQIADWATGALGRVTVGSVTISFASVATATTVFIAALILTRATQHILDRRILRRARIDPGTRSSLRTGTGYLGVVVALLAALMALGLDLSKLALIAGALSIGVGFGLQTIANNFISGLILLIERPIKAGDWIVVGDQEGIVRRIRVRATEIETFQRSSVLVPNSELVSRAVVNWTFKDHTGRVDVSLKLDERGDADAMLRAAEAAACRHPGVLPSPSPRALLRTGPEYELVLQLWAFINVKDSDTKFRIETELLAELVRARQKLSARPAGYRRERQPTAV